MCFLIKNHRNVAIINPDSSPLVYQKYSLNNFCTQQKINHMFNRLTASIL